MEGYFNGTMLDCIRETEGALRNIISHRRENTASLLADLERERPISRICLVGSGTSNTAAVTARAWMEKILRIPVQTMLPSTLLYETTAYDSEALYLFTSQTGTSRMAGEALDFILEKGFHNAVISESPDTPMARKASAFINMDCGIEEYPMRTEGYTASVMTMMVIALELARQYGRCSDEVYEKAVTELSGAADRVGPVIEKALAWAGKVKRQLLRSDLIVFTGADALYGVALEGAMKMWETLQTASVGYEIEDGIHGPNYGYNFRHCVVVLNHGGRENDKCQALARYMKEVWQNGLVIGPHPVDETDLELAPPDDATGYVDFVLTLQVLTYVCARDQGRDLKKHHDNSRMQEYFRTHI
ncbi:MAG: SIS domain-containing protein [Lachnospiraceae bacterium]|nr:SIS domain-containing protein [Lachnospiraceae bacterium]